MSDKKEARHHDGNRAEGRAGVLNSDYTQTLLGAKALADLGLPVFPCNRKKQPYIKWKEGATTDHAEIERLWRQFPDAMIGMPTGAASGIVVLDVDINKDKDIRGDDSLADLEKQYGKLPDTLEVKTPSGGRHFYFKNPTDADIRNSTSDIGSGLDIRGNGGYVIVPPSVSERGVYDWEGEDDDFSWERVADMPRWLVDLTKKKERPDSAPVQGIQVKPNGEIDAYAKRALESAITNIALENEGARNRTLNEEAFGLFGLVKAGRLPEDKVRKAIWNAAIGVGLEETEIKNTMRSAWKDAEPRWPEGNAAEGAAIAAGLVAGQIEVGGKVWQHPQTDTKLFELPGKLGEIFQWAMSFAHRPQPHLTVNAVLAGMSSVMARRYRTTVGNWPSLYYLNIAPSAAGKEHAKDVVELMLDGAGLSERISGSGYTSSAAVLSQLRAHPAHTTIIDEIGKAFGAAQANGNQHKLDALTSLIEAWGRCDSVMHAANYSTMGLSRSQVKELESNHIHNPAITLLGMTTPETIYSSLSTAWIQDGFLPRFVIVDSPIGRQAGQFPQKTPMPEHLAEWLREMAVPPGSGNLAGIVETHDLKPAPHIVHIDTNAMAMVREFEKRVLKRMDKLEKIGIEAMVGRDVEKAMRLAMIVGAKPGPFTISVEAMAWAIDYIEHHSGRMIEKLNEWLHESEFGAIKAHVLNLIRRAGERGMTHRELTQYSRKYKSMRPYEQKELIEALARDGDVVMQHIKPPRGRMRETLVAIDPD